MAVCPNSDFNSGPIDTVSMDTTHNHEIAVWDWYELWYELWHRLWYELSCAMASQSNHLGMGFGMNYGMTEALVWHKRRRDNQLLYSVECDVCEPII